jgi:hypothetical protein
MSWKGTIATMGKRKSLKRIGRDENAGRIGIVQISVDDHGTTFEKYISCTGLKCVPISLMQNSLSINTRVC